MQFLDNKTLVCRTTSFVVISVNKIEQDCFESVLLIVHVCAWVSVLCVCACMHACEIIHPCVSPSCMCLSEVVTCLRYQLMKFGYCKEKITPT